MAWENGTPTLARIPTEKNDTQVFNYSLHGIRVNNLNLGRTQAIDYASAYPVLNEFLIATNNLGRRLFEGK